MAMSARTLANWMHKARHGQLAEVGDARKPVTDLDEEVSRLKRGVCRIKRLRRRFKATTHSDHHLPVAPNLLPTGLSITSGICIAVLQDATVSIMRFMAPTFDDRGQTEVNLRNRNSSGSTPSLQKSHSQYTCSRLAYLTQRLPLVGSHCLCNHRRIARSVDSQSFAS